MRKSTIALVSLLALSALAHWMGEFQLGYLLLPVFVGVIAALAFWSPPMVGSFLLFGWVILPAMDSLPFGGVPRLPATSIVALAVLASLITARINGESGRGLLRPVVGLYAGLFLLIFGLGYLGIYLNGKWGNILVQALAWQKLISCASMFLCGLLCCRNRADFWLILRHFPVWFAIYLLFIPPEIYLEFARNVLTGDSAYAIGLSYETLNTNTLGQGACLTAVVSYVLLAHRAEPVRNRLFYFAIFFVAVLVTLASASRQSLLALLVGLWVAFTRARPVLGCLLALGALAAVGVIKVKLLEADPAQSFVARYSDLAKPADEWSTVSASARQHEIDAALEHLGDRPLLGFGFGGYSLARDLPDIETRSDLNDPDLSDRLWADGFYLVGEHNFPLALYLQTGVVGMMAFMLLCLGPYFRLRRQNRRLPVAERESGRTMDVAMASLWAAIFILQNLSGGFALGSMGTLFFFIGALVSGFAVPAAAASRRPADSIPLLDEVRPGHAS